MARVAKKTTTQRSGASRSLRSTEAWARVARQRAAHFANPDEEDEEQAEEEENEEEEDAMEDGEEERQAAIIAEEEGALAKYYDNGEENDIHVGGDNARELGPWSSARQLLEQRGRAKRQRAETSAVHQVQKAEAAEAEVGWVPSRDFRRRRSFPLDQVPPLVDLLNSWVADRAEDVETLAGLPDAIRRRLSRALTKRRRIVPETVSLLTDGAATEVEIGNGAYLDEDALGVALEKCELQNLEVLELRFCGRGLLESTLRRLLRFKEDKKTEGSLPRLREVLFEGAYRLNDDGLLLLIQAAPNLQKLHVPACSRLTNASLANLTVLNSLHSLDLTQCHQLSPHNIASMVSDLPSLQRLRLSNLPELTDEAVADMLANVGARLKELDISLNPELKDEAIAAIGACCPNIEVLNIERLPKLSSKSLSPLAAGCKNLQILKIEESKASDADLAELMGNGSPFREISIRRVPNAANLTAKALASLCSSSLTALDISFCRSLNNAAMGLLVDSCENLESLTVWGCSQLTEKFFHGHSSDQLKVVGAHDPGIL